jgi:hypothetical protein
MVRWTSGPAVKLNPRNLRSCGRATALFASCRRRSRSAGLADREPTLPERRALGHHAPAGVEHSGVLYKISLFNAVQRGALTNVPNTIRFEKLF